MDNLELPLGRFLYADLVVDYYIFNYCKYPLKYNCYAGEVWLGYNCEIVIMCVRSDALPIFHKKNKIK